MRVLAVGDVSGEDGTRFLQKTLPPYKRVAGVDCCIVNGENSNRGNGITPDSMRDIFAAGADVITTGNHAFHRREMYDTFDSSEFVLRPANFPEAVPGRGWCIIDKGRYQVGVINLMGTVYMEPLGNPFQCVDSILKKMENCKVILLDFHAEATSEKRAMGFYLDGKVSAVYGTHTHVQTADEQILPKGTGYMTDIGMTGPVQSVLGVSPDIIIQKLRTNLPVRFDLMRGGEQMLNGCLFDIDEHTGRTTAVERVRLT